MRSHPPSSVKNAIPSQAYCKHMSTKIAECYRGMWEALGSTFNTAKEINKRHLPRVNRGVTSLTTRLVCHPGSTAAGGLGGCSEETSAIKTTVTMAVTAASSSASGAWLQS